MPAMEERVYEVVELRDVPNDVWLAGTRALHFCERDLGLSLKIEWIKEVPPHWEGLTMAFARLMATCARLDGEMFVEPQAFRSEIITGQIGWLFNDGVMKVAATLTPAEVIKTVAHEAKHIHDSQQFRPPRTDEESAIAEARAREYERRVWAQLADGAGAQRS